MLQSFTLRPSRLILALLMLAAGGIGVVILSKTDLNIGGTDFTSIVLILAGLIFYLGILVIVAMFQNEKLLSIAILLPSIVAVAIFVYGFIGWSLRVSLSQWKGLTPDFTFVGLKQYIALFNNDPRFVIDVRNTAVFTVGLSWAA